MTRRTMSSIDICRDASSGAARTRRVAFCSAASSAVNASREHGVVGTGRRRRWPEAPIGRRRCGGGSRRTGSARLARSDADLAMRREHSAGSVAAGVNGLAARQDPAGSAAPSAICAAPAATAPAGGSTRAAARCTPAARRRACWQTPRRADRSSPRAIRPRPRAPTAAGALDDLRPRPRRAADRTAARSPRRLAMAGEQILHAADHHLRLERLHEHAVAADRARARLVHRLEGAGQQQHRDVRELRIVP